MTDNKVFIYLSLVSLILLPKVGLIDFSMVPLGLLAASIFLSRPSLKFVVAHDIRVAVAIFFVLQIFALIASLYHKLVITEDIFFKPLRQIIILVLLAIVFSRKKFEIRDVENVIIIAAVINAIVIFVQYILHNSGISTDFLLVPGFDIVGDVNASFRKPGLATGYPIAGLLEVYGTVLILSRINKHSDYKASILFLITALSVLLTSRMALLMLISVGLVYIVHSIVCRNIKPVVLIGALCLIPIVFVALGVVNQDTIDVMFELFINYLSGKGFTSLSGDALKDSYAFWPQHVDTLLFGNGLSAKSDDGFTVDASAQIVLFGGGLVPLILYNILLLFYFWRSYITTNQRLVVFLIFILNIISNIKVNTLFSRVIGDIVTLIFVAHVYYKYNSNAYIKHLDPKVPNWENDSSSIPVSGRVL